MATLTPLVGPTCQTPLSPLASSRRRRRAPSRHLGPPAAPPHPVARTSPLPPDPRPSSPPPLDPRTAELGAAGSTRGAGPASAPPPQRPQILCWGRRRSLRAPPLPRRLRSSPGRRVGGRARALLAELGGAWRRGHDGEKRREMGVGSVRPILADVANSHLVRIFSCGLAPSLPLSNQTP